MAVVLKSLASLVLLGIGMLALMLPRDAGDKVETPPTDPVEIVELMEAVENGEIEDEAKKAADQFGLTAAGDTCLMRHPRLLAGVPRPLRQRLAAARIDEGGAGRAIGAQLETELSGLALWRLRIQQSDHAIRSRDPAGAKTALDQATAVPDVPPACQSDAFLLHARIASQTGDLARASAALTAATQTDPGNFNAHFEHAVLAVQRLSKGGVDCVAAIPDMVESTIRIQALIGASSQLWRLKERVSQLSAPETQKAFLFGFIQERSGAEGQAMATYAKAIGRLKTENDRCAAALSAALRLSLERVAKTAKPDLGNAEEVTR